MKKKRNQARNHRSLQVITLCISTAMVLVLIGIVVLTVFTGRNLSNYVKENLTVTMVLQPDLTPSECAALCKKVQRFDYITNVEYTSKPSKKARRNWVRIQPSLLAKTPLRQRSSCA